MGSRLRGSDGENEENGDCRCPLAEYVNSQSGK
jgi:hypothetical protein